MSKFERLHPYGMRFVLRRIVSTNILPLWGMTRRFFAPRMGRNVGRINTMSKKWSASRRRNLQGKDALLAPGSLGDRDATAEICRDKKGNPEPDPELRDTENVPFPPGIHFPLPLDYEGKQNKGKVDIASSLALVQDHCEAYCLQQGANQRGSDGRQRSSSLFYPQCSRVWDRPI